MASTATRQVSIPAGTAAVDLQVKVAGTAGVNGTAEVVVTGGGVEQTVFAVTDGERGPRRVTADLSAFAGETVTLRLATAGDARLAVESVKLAVDADGDGITDARERAGLPTGGAGVVATDPFDADTDNDGLPDGAEFGREVSVGGREFVRLRSHPLRVDWDDDGLTDREERRGWTIRVARDKNSAQAAHNASRRGESIDPHTASVDVAADPMLADTDGDGLTDGREHDLGTDPESVDTDTDSIEDGRELEVGEDPTLHDFSPPTISVLAINAHNVPDRDNQTLDVYDVVYEVVYRVEDPSGVSRTVVFKNDVRRDVDHFDGPTDTGSHDSAFVFESYSQYLAEVYFAPQASVKAVDIHGNADRITKRDSGLYARLAELVPKLPGTLRLVKQAFPVSLTPLEAVGLLAGFSFAVGQGVNDVITLIRNPDQLKAFVDLAKAIYERPDILPTLVEAFVDSFQRFHNVQNPFPGPQNLLNPTNPDSFTTDNSTFGRTWFGGYALAFVAIGVVTGGASAAGLTALEGLSATAANAIRLVINAPSIIATRAVGLLGRSALRVAIRVGRATELRVSAVKRAVDGLPTPRLHAVRRDVLLTDGGHVEEFADAGLSKEAAEYLVRTGRHRGRVLLNGLSPEQALQLLDASDAIHDPLVAAWRRSDAVDAETVRDVVDVADELGARRTAALADFLDQDGAARLVGEEGVDATTMRRILDDDAGDVAVDLHHDLGVSGRRIDELVEAGLDLDRHEDGLRYVLRVRDQRKTQNENQIAEILAEQTLRRRHYPRSEGYTIRNNVDLLRGDDNLQEIDHVIFKDGDVIGFGQTKNSVTRSALRKARKQNTDTRRFLRNRDRIDHIVDGEGEEIDISRFDLENIDESDIFRVGADEQFEVVNYNERQVGAIFETLKNID